jgi:hypothetical protein
MANNRTTTVIGRLLDDEYIHEQVAAAGAGARDAYRRVRRLPPEKALQDKTVYDHVRQSVAGLTEATRRALDKPEPKPSRAPRVLGLLILAGTAGVVVWATKKQNRGSSVPPATTAAPPPPPPGPPPGPVSAGPSA